MHRALAETGYKGDRHQVEKTVDETFESEFGCTVLTGPVFDNLLSYFPESGPLRNYRNIAMHLAVDFDALYDITAIGLEPAVEVMQIIYSGYLPCCPVEYLGRNRLCDRI